MWVLIFGGIFGTLSKYNFIALFGSSSVVEQSAVNRLAVGSNPTSRAIKNHSLLRVIFIYPKSTFELRIKNKKSCMCIAHTGYKILTTC